MRPVFSCPGEEDGEGPAPEGRGLIIKIGLPFLSFPRELVIQENIDTCVHLAFSILIVIPNLDDKTI